jgi:hypothetical protein
MRLIKLQSVFNMRLTYDVRFVCHMSFRPKIVLRICDEATDCGGKAYIRGLVEIGKHAMALTSLCLTAACLLIYIILRII